MTDVRYAKSGDAHLAYAVDGERGPFMLHVAPFTISIDSLDDEPHSARFYRRMMSFARVIRYDRRGTGLSDPFGGDDVSCSHPA
ncbi:MAG: hypothetical protein SGJ13_09620 [Actinomycetota bacterium]|nr:hypothetical protein [Actinomycetota bacterium]